MQNNLYRAFEETAVSRIIQKVPQMPDHKFSRKFERKMKKLIRHGYRETVHNRKITVKRLFVCITAALIAAVVMAFSVGAVRDFFKNFFMEVFGTHTTVQTFSDNINVPISIKDVYMIDMPNGFDMVYKDEIFEWSPFIAYIYRKDDDYISFNQFLKSEYDVDINTENRPLDYIEINGNDGYIVDLGNNEYYISWDNGD
ncbi:MAG: DUF4367 domain-containing protein, partial [Ruminococcus sp.]|nr:DUF4367 domain-containing protein [Ruminococcus sp.]